MIIKPPHNLNAIQDKFSVFLAGSIEMGIAQNWQQKIEQALEETEHICILNPRRDDWDSSWKQSIENKQFNEQVTWELEGLEKANMIVFYFSPETKSPVSMLELGLFARTGKIIVCCPDGFWRKGNIDVVCKKYNIEQVNNLEEIITKIKNKNYEN
ncbi:MAG: nucleoside 2-deoxyribosyltransferase domain-containing protein [Bacteroidetes bacterium]|nr:nucleoside 2-deoxyribosyltransferase domain-containing protein [Bacteroidota bacterium]